MNAYVLVEVRVIDVAGFNEYVLRVAPLVAKHGGRYLVKDAAPNLLSGQGPVPELVVIIEFPTLNAADGFIRERSATDLPELFNRSTQGQILRLTGSVP